MMDIIRAFIRESVCELRLEDGFADDVIGRLGLDRSIGDDPQAFARRLTKDIPELMHYQLVDYMPINGIKEKWVFEVDTSRNVVNTITVKHILVNGTSHWQFVFAQAEKSMEKMVADIQYSTPVMDDYNEWTEKVNTDWQEWE